MILTISDTHICMRLGLHVTMPTRHTTPVGTGVQSERHG
jgi:hypothetical protein